MKAQSSQSITTIAGEGYTAVTERVQCRMRRLGNTPCPGINRIIQFGENVCKASLRHIYVQYNCDSTPSTGEVLKY